MTRSDFLVALASGVALWPGLFLLVGGSAKAFDLTDSQGGEDTVLARLLADRIPLRAAWAAVAAVEIFAGGLVLAGVLVPWAQFAAAAALSFAALVALWGVRNAPDAGCGCMGTRAPDPVDPLTVVRAGALAALALVAGIGGEPWTHVFDSPAAVVACLAVGLGLVPISPDRRELRGERLRAAGTRARLRAGNAVCARRRIPVERTLERLRRSELWRDASRHVAAELPTEHWEEGCWRFMCFPASYEGEPATAVFALHLGADQAGNGVSFVNEEQQRVLGEIRAARPRGVKQALL